jgi:hypothetical protein
MKLLITTLALLVVSAMTTRAADAKENYDKAVLNATELLAMAKPRWGKSSALRT